MLHGFILVAAAPERTFFLTAGIESGHIIFIHINITEIFFEFFVVYVIRACLANIHSLSCPVRPDGIWTVMLFS